MIRIKETLATSTVEIAGHTALDSNSLGANITESSLTRVGTLTEGTWSASVISSQYGGTGVNNQGKTITLAGNLTTQGAYPITIIATGDTEFTLPTSGSLATADNVQTYTNKTFNLAAENNNTLTGTIAEFNLALSDQDFATLAGTETLTNKTVNLTNNTLSGTVAQFNSALSDGSFATLAGTETVTNKTVDLANNTLSGTLAQFNTALSDGSFATLAGSETLTNKTINLNSASGNTLTGTLTEFNSALNGADFASLSGTETLTNKTVNLANNSLSGTIAQFNSALSDGAFATLAGSETVTNKTINLANNTLSGTISQFNSALSDGAFATLAGSETVTNKTINLTNNTITGSIAQFNSALSDGAFATLAGSETLTNKSIDLGTNTLTGSIAEFNASLEAATFVTSDASTNDTTLPGNLKGPATFTIDPAAHGDNTGTVVIAGNLQVDGTTTTINSTTLTVDDKNVVLSAGSTNKATSDGAGITVDLGSDGSATLTYSSSNDRWEMNKSLAASVIGNVTGQVSDISNFSTTNLTEGSNLYYTDARVDARLSATPSDNQKVYTANGTITAGDIVSVKNDGTVEKVKQTIFDPVLTPSSNNHPLSTPNIIKVIHNYNNNSVITIIPNGQSKIYVGTFSNGVLTNNLYGQTVNQTPQPITAVFDSHANRLIVAYVISGDGTNFPTLGIGIEVGEFDYGLATVTFSSYRTWLLELDQAVANQYGVELTYDYNNNIPLLFVYGQSAMAADHFKVYQLDPLTTAGVDGIIKNADANNPSNHTLVVDPGTQLMITSQFPSWEFIPTINAIFIVVKASGFSPPYFYLYGVESTATGMTYLGKKNLSPLNPTTGFLAADNNSGELALTYNEDNDSLLIFGNAGSVTEDNLLGASITPINSWLTTYNDFVTVKSDYSTPQYRVMAKYNSTLQTYFLTYRISDILYARTAEIVNDVLEIHNDEQELYDYTGIFAQNGSGTSFMYGTDKTQPDTFIVNNQLQTQHITYTPGYSLTNANAWSGIAYTSGLDTENVIVTFPGAIDNNQTGLVKDTIYYVGIDGTLATTKTEYGMIGKAISDTTLQIYGNIPIEFTKNIDIDFTNIDNKAVLTKTSSTNTYQFIKSSADSSQAYTAYEDISAGNLVTLRNDNTVAILKPNIVFTDGVRVATTKLSSGEFQLLTDRTNNRLIAINAMENNLTDNHNQAGFIQFLQVTNNTVQELPDSADPSSSWITTGGTASTGHSAVWIEHLSKGLVIYSNSGIHWKLFDYNNTQVNILATGTFTTNDDWYLDAYYDETTGKVFVVRAFNSPSMMDTDQFAVHIMTVAADNTVTIENGWQAIGQGLLNNFHYQIPKIAYNPDLNQLYVFFYERSGSVYRLWVTDLTESIGFDTGSPMLTTVFTSQTLYSDLANDGRGIHFLYHKLQKKLILWGHELNNRTNLTVISNLSNLTTSYPTEFQNGDLIFTDHRFEDSSDNWWKGCEYDSNNGLLYLSQAVPSSYASNAIRKLYIVEVKGNNSINILDTLTVAPTTGDPTGYGFASSFNPNTNKLALFYDIEHPAATTTYYKLTSLDITASGTFFGIAEDNIPASSSGTINLSGSVNRSQQGLSPNVSYYISSIGTLTSLSDGGQFLGTALSATELYIKQNQLNELTDVDFTTNTPTNRSGLVLTSDGDSTYSFQKVIGNNQKKFTVDGNIVAGDIVSLGKNGNVIKFSILQSALLPLDNPNAFDTSASDWFGRSVALSESYAIVGAPFEDDTGGDQSGKAYIFDTATGNLLHTLDNPNAYDTSAQDNFGLSVAISESHAIVGVPGETGTNTYSFNTGIAYIYDTATGNLLYTLNNPDLPAGAYSQFANSVSISESYAIVGAYSQANIGKVYIYDLSTLTPGTVSSATFVLENPNFYGFGSYDYFGYSVSISESYAIVGAQNEYDASGNSYSGIAYIYDLSTLTPGTITSATIVLDNPNTSAYDNFGLSVAISESYAIVGAPNEDDTGGDQSGKAYIFDTATGNLLYTLDNPNVFHTSAGDNFGYSVSISESYAIVGAPNEDDEIIEGDGSDDGSGGTTTTTGTDGPNQAGKAYIYDLSTLTPGTITSATIVLDNPSAFSTSSFDTFGNSVAISESHAIVGAIGEDDSGGNNSGKAYIFKNLSTIDTIYPAIIPFLGIAAENISDATTGIIDLQGSINRNQAQLTPNSIYYANNNGNLTTTVTDYTVGRAISTTDIQIFGKAVSEFSTSIDVDFTTNRPITTSGLVLTSDGDSSYSFQNSINISGAITANSLHSLFMEEYVNRYEYFTPNITTYISNSGSIVYMTVDMTGDITVNVTGNGNTTLDDLLAVSRSVTVVFMFTNGATAYINNIFQIDNQSQTVKWNGGAAPIAGTANAIDVYSYTIIKTAANTYTVLGSFSSFA